MYCEAACYQRFGSARSGQDIKTAYSLMLSMGVTFSATMAFAGLGALAFFGNVTDVPSNGFWAMVFDVLPIGFRGLFVAALCAAVMSTIESDWLLFAACSANDIYKGFINKNAPEKQVVMGIRIMVVVFGICTIIGTIFWADGIANAWYYLGGFLFDTFFIPILAGLFYKKKTTAGALVCICYSFVMYLIWEFVLACPFEIPTSIFVFVTGGILYFIVCAITYKGDKNDGDSVKVQEV